MGSDAHVAEQIGETPHAVTFRVTPNDYAASMKMLMSESAALSDYQRQWKKTNRAFIVSIGGITALLFLAIADLNGLSVPVDANLSVGVACGISLVWTINGLQRLVKHSPKLVEDSIATTKQAIAQGAYPNLSVIQSLRLTDEGLYAESAMNTSVWRWGTGVAGIHEGDEVVLIRLSNRMVYIIPRRSFPHGLAVSDFVERAQALQEAAAAATRYAGDRRCRRCAYDLQGTFTNICPECGLWDTPEIDDLQLDDTQAR